MPIAHLYVAPSRVKQVAEAAETLGALIETALFLHLKPAPETVQIAFVESFAMPRGCELVLVVQHRASASRTPAVRDAAAQDLRDRLHLATGASIRVRLIALEPSDIAASDVLEGAR